MPLYPKTLDYRLPVQRPCTFLFNPHLRPPQDVHQQIVIAYVSDKSKREGVASLQPPEERKICCGATFQDDHTVFTHTKKLAPGSKVVEEDC